MSRPRYRTLFVLAFALVAALIPLAAQATPQGDRSKTIEVVSSHPDEVSGGTARLVVRTPSGERQRTRVIVNGSDQTDSFVVRADGNLEGVITNLEIGDNTVAVRQEKGQRSRSAADAPGVNTPQLLGEARAEITLVNHPIEGPMFSGPHQDPFFCATPDDYGAAELGGPIDDNCTMETVVSYKYRTTGDSWANYDPSAARPGDMAMTTTMDGDTVDYIVRWERGTINRFIYSIAMLSPVSQDIDAPDLSAWNDRTIYYFQGGVGIGHYQGDPSTQRMLYDHGLGEGYAVIYSTGTRASTHYNLEVGGETAIMVKDRFVTQYGLPDYTVGVGGSGGAIQQYIYAQNHEGLIDAAIPQYSYPDMITQTINVGDCELLERWMDTRLFGGDTMWANWENRTLLEGMAAWNNIENQRYAAMPPGYPEGSSECIQGWMGLSPLVLNPHFGTAPGITPGEQASVEWTHFGDAINIYGVAADGFAARTWSNEGVQYGLDAVAQGAITPEQFIDLNANVGSWKNEPDMVQEGCPYISALCPDPADLAGLPPFPDIWPNLIDPWSARNMNLSTDGGLTPAPRATADPGAVEAAYERGLVNIGDIQIPVIDWRNYLELELDMHNSRQSFSTRQRMLNYDGDASNQVIWFTGVADGQERFDQTPMAFEVIEEWMRNIEAHPNRGVARNKPAAAVDSCFNADGELIASGEGVWSGVIDGGSDGVCTQEFPIFSTSRVEAGAPFSGDMFVCELMPVSESIARGDYGAWSPTTEETAALETIFPDGACDYTKGDVGRP